jgi:hypothetical protein
MIQSGMNASAEPLLNGRDAEQHYRYVKRLIQELKADDHTSLKKELFGEGGGHRAIDQKQIKELFRVLRKLERNLKECCTAPIPDELEGSIRSRDGSEWLPWEMEAIEKVDAWREEVQEKRMQARQILDQALDKLRQSQQPS